MLFRKPDQAPDAVQDPAYFQAAREGIQRLIQNINSVITIDPAKLEYIVAAKIAGGHVILADTHGVGKTSLARALAGSINWEGFKATREGIEVDSFNRIQCTVDLLPQDIVGFNRYEMSGQTQFNRGPIFAHFVLCDEINLLTPKTQGSFFQAMEEQLITIEGTTFELPDPFFIIATMNLRGAHLFPLPAPQLDRFMIQISLGYPEQAAELSIVLKHGTDQGWRGFGPVVEASELLAWQRLVDSVSAKDEVVEYIVNLVRKTRGFPGVVTGASPRSGIKLLRMARSLALVRGMDYIDKDIIKEVCFPALAHRLELEDASSTPESVLERVLTEVRV